MRHCLLLAGNPLLWLVGRNIDWDCLVPCCIMGSRDQWGFPPFFRPQWQCLCTTLTTGKCLPLGLCKGIVKESKKRRLFNPFLHQNFQLLSRSQKITPLIPQSHHTPGPCTGCSRAVLNKNRTSAHGAHTGPVQHCTNFAFLYGAFRVLMHAS